MKEIHCKMFGHDYHISRNVTYHVKEYTCTRCHKQLTTGVSGELVKLTPKFKEINDVLERIHTKRNKKKLREKILFENLLVFKH
ncbi:DUF1660 family phage protein [Gaetbulibacter sp. M235]|uniref:DUF1660 family phage protein n=1 Tax=Gaetbulibacter sp. M235 TaxID=3126510 RepID=UPI00374F23EA